MRRLGARDKSTPEDEAEIENIHRYCERIGGDWWQRVKSNDEGRLSYFQIKPDHVAHTVQMEGDSFDAKGMLIAHWRSVAAGIHAKDRVLCYSWEGEHPTSAPGGSFKGFGQFVFRDSNGIYDHADGFFASTLVGAATTVWKSVELRRVDTRDLKPVQETMLKGSDEAKAQMISVMLGRFNSS